MIIWSRKVLVLQDFINKPFDVNMLVRMIDCLKKSR